MACLPGALLHVATERDRNGLAQRALTGPARWRNGPILRRDADPCRLSATRQTRDVSRQARAGAAPAIAPLPGDASTRHYARLSPERPQGDADGPAADSGSRRRRPRTPTPEERRALGYNAVARLAGADCARFVAVVELSARTGSGAPEIYAADPAQGFVLIWKIWAMRCSPMCWRMAAMSGSCMKRPPKFWPRSMPDAAPPVLPPDKAAVTPMTRPRCSPKPIC